VTRASSCLTGFAIFLAATTTTTAIAENATWTPETMSEAAISQLKAGHAKQALSGFFGANPLMDGKQNELAVLEGQITSAFSIYGPLRSCELVETAKRGTLVENRMYLCQHDHFVSRWRFLMIRTASGWMGNNFSFDEKVTQSFDRD
jgi:hypothetical protein